jgi:flagellar protein FliS
MTFTLSAQRTYANDAVLSASPVRLLTLLYDRLMHDLQRAAGAHESADWETMSANLLHAQAIIAELTSSLKVELWDGGEGLRALYVYCQTLLMNANVRRDATGIREAIEHLEPLRQAWHEAAAQLSTSPAASSAGGHGRDLGVA